MTALRSPAPRRTGCRARPCLLPLVALLLMAALAPAGPMRDLVLCLDVSGSIDDSELAIEIDGLKACLADALPQDGSHAVAIIVYGLTTDAPLPLLTPVTVANRAAIIDPALDALLADRLVDPGGTNTGQALVDARLILTGIQSPGDDDFVLLVGDGASNVGPDVPTECDAAQAAGIIISSIAVGAGAAGQAELEACALATGGVFGIAPTFLDFLPVCADAFAFIVPDRLTLEVASDCIGDDPMVVELWMRDLGQFATGFQAFLEYDTGALAYRGDLSSYTSDPFPLHIQDLVDAEITPGRLRLDGSDALGDPGTIDDALLAVLVFDVVADCTTPTVTFDESQPFDSELSFQGVPIATTTIDAPAFLLDITPPTITCVVGIVVAADPASCCAAGDLVESEACGDSTNGGCADGPDAFIEAAFGQTWCGTGWADGGQRDADWYRVDLVDSPAVTAELSSEFPAVVQIVDGLGGCTPFVVAQAWSSDCMPAVVSAPVPPGTYAVVVTPANPDGSPILTGIPCGSANQYRLRLSGEAAPTGAGRAPIGRARPAGAGLADPACRGAVVFFDAPVAADACDGAPTVVCVPPSGSFFPIGITTVWCTATDACGNAGTCSFEVVVTATNLIAVDVELPGSLPTTRCIRFVTDDCGQTVDVELAFTDHDLDPGTPVRAAAIVEVDCGTWTSLCAKDEQHTQWDTTSLSLSGDGSMYVADAVLTLTPGDTDDDGDVDINDVTWLVFTFGSLAADGGCAWDGTRDADFNNGGAVGSEDYSLLSDAWQTSTSCACAAPAPAAASAIGTDRLAPEVAARVDLDGSGVFDATDVRLFEIINALPRTLSERMGWTAQQAGKGSNP